MKRSSIKIFLILTIFTLLLSGAFFRAPQPSQASYYQITANPAAHWIMGFFWPEGVEVTLTVGDYTATAISIPAPWDPINTTYANFDLTGILDLVPGDIITMSGDGATKTLTVTNFAVTDIDVDADTLSGTASAWGDVIACADFPGGCRFTTAGADGSWEAGPGVYVLAPGVFGWAAETDVDGDQTRMDWRVANPYVIVNPYWDSVAGKGMPVGTELVLQIKEAGEVVFTSVPTPIEQDPNNPSDYYANFDLQGFNVNAGQMMITTGQGISSTYTVTDFNILNIDPQADIISGIATPDSNVMVGTNAPDCCAIRFLKADENGNWIADFSQPGPLPGEEDVVNIRGGSNGWGNENDIWGNQTWSAWKYYLYNYMPFVTR